MLYLEGEKKKEESKPQIQREDDFDVPKPGVKA